MYRPANVDIDAGVADVVDVGGGDADVGDGESVHWLLEYWSWSWSARSCFDPGIACSRSDLGGWRERARIYLPTTAQRSHLLK